MKVESSSQPAPESPLVNFPNPYFSLIGESQYSSFSPEDLLQEKIRTARKELLPINHLLLKDSILDRDHVRELAKNLSETGKQLSPLLVRARFNGQGSITYDLIDGYHQGTVLLEIGHPTAEAVVIYDCSDEELFDLRILAAKSVKSIQFARTAEWMEGSYSQTRWARWGIKLLQSMNLAVYDSNGGRLKLPPEEINQVKDWVKQKSVIWQKPITAIWEELKAVEAGDPELVNQVRVIDGKPEQKGVLSPTRLLAVVLPLPRNYQLQNRIMQIVLEYNLTEKETHALTKAVKEVRTDNEKLTAVFKNPFPAISAMMALIRKDDIPEPLYNISTIHIDQPAGYLIPGRDEGLLPDEINEIKTTSTESGFWWRSFPFLTESERTVLTLVLDKGLDFEDIAKKYDKLNHKIEKLFFSGIRRYVIFTNDQINRQECRRTSEKNHHLSETV